ncbi:MAG: hypothetical protein ACHQ6V_04670 [Myxococcota bacterium]
MRAVRLAVALFVVAASSIAWSCGPFAIVSVSPANGASVATPSFSVQIVTDAGLVPGTLAATLNGVPVPLAGGPTTWTASYGAGAPLRDQNLLEVTGKGTNGAAYRLRNSFAWLPPKARVRRIAQASELITGPLGHSRIGDWLFENDVARFVVQDAPQRDLHSVGQYGGEIIDAELIGREGRDAFLALATSLNIETVVNPISIVVVNDGQDGTPAILRACGPDDLLDYVNASSQVAQLGATFPAAADDRNYAVDACIEYVLQPGRRDVQLNTTVFSSEAATRRFWPGYYVNGGGTLEQWQDTAQDPFAGLGEMLVTGSNLALSYFGTESSEGVDYGVLPLQIPTSAATSSSFTTSGVTFMLHSQSIATLLAVPAGAPGPLQIPAGGNRIFSAHFAVGDGSASNTSELRAELDGTPTGTLEGCVSAGGVPLPGARVAVALATGATIDHVVSHFVTDASGCYSGRIPAGSYAAVAGKNGYPYEADAASPPLHPVAIAANAVVTENFALPATATLRVNVTDASGAPTPARVNVIGFDPSREPTIFSQVSTLLPSSNTGVLNDVSRDVLGTGFAALAFADANGAAEVQVEPGSYQVYVTRGSEWSAFGAPVTLSGGATTLVNAQIVRVLDTAGFISSDYHVHQVNSPDSRVANARRLASFAAEGVENLIATDHDAITNLAPELTALGLAPFLHTTIGEEITSFDYGHFNSYPQAQDLTRVSNGSTDWAGAAAPGADFPSLGSFGLTPAQIEAAAKGKAQNAALPTVVQINHIDSHFDPLRIDTAQTPPRSNLAACPGSVANPCPTFFRLNPAVTNFFHAFAALELWNGSNNSHQTQFLDERIGIWMNLLNQGILSTAIADTDTHSVVDLETAGARTWTPSSSDAPNAISDAEIAQAVSSSRAVGGQGLYVQTRLVEGAQAADFSLGGTTLVTATDGSVNLEIHVQAPIWAPYDTIEIYRNASTRVAHLNGTTPTLYDAVPTTTLSAGTDFSVATTNVAPSVPGAQRLETHLTLPLAGLTRDEWIVVVAKGTSGVSAPMFPVFPRNLSGAQNPTLGDLVNVTASESGVRALGFTNALFVDVDGNGDFDPPGVSVVP